MPQEVEIQIIDHNDKHEFYRRWIEKSKTQTYAGMPDDIYFVFDEFISLYIVYNFLYREVFRELRSKDPQKYKLRGSRKKYIPDKETATEFIGDYIDLEEFYKNDIQESDLCKLRSLIKDNGNGFIFNICLDPATGNPLKKEDQNLADGIMNEDPKTVVKSVLLMIYEVRCNLFHGSKKLSRIQNDLLKPLCSILRSLVEKVYAQLKASEHSY